MRADWNSLDDFEKELSDSDLVRWIEKSFDDSGDDDDRQTPKRKVTERYENEANDSIIKQSSEKKKSRKAGVRFTLISFWMFSMKMRWMLTYLPKRRKIVQPMIQLDFTVSNLSTSQKEPNMRMS